MRKIKTVDWLLFNYPEFYLRSRSIEPEKRGMTEFLPRVNQPKSPVERVVISRHFMYEVAQILETAVNTLDEYQREIVHVKYGWRWSDDGIDTYPPTSTSQTYKVLCGLGFRWSEEKFYADLGKIRDCVSKYTGALSRTTLREISVMMPKRNKGVPRDQIEKVFEYIEGLRKNTVKIQ